MPGKNNGIAGYTNWWDFIGDWDSALNSSEKLFYTGVTINKLGDINGDNLVNSADLAILLSTWGSTIDLRADINKDGKVTSADLAVLLSRWGS